MIMGKILRNNPCVPQTIGVFACGHKRTPENSRKQFGARVACLICARRAGRLRVAKGQGIEVYSVEEL
jgi:hypothetical protein